MCTCCNFNKLVHCTNVRAVMYNCTCVVGLVQYSSVNVVRLIHLRVCIGGVCMTDCVVINIHLY